MLKGKISSLTKLAGGLLAVRVDQSVRLVEFDNRPTSFVIGVLGFPGNLAGLQLCCWYLRRLACVPADSWAAM